MNSRPSSPRNSVYSDAFETSLPASDEPVAPYSPLNDDKLYQSPIQSLFHPRFIIGNIMGLIPSILINVIIAVIAYHSDTHMPLYRQMSDFSSYKFAPVTIIADLLATGIPGVFIGTVITTFFISINLKQGKAKPIRSESLHSYRWTGATVHNVFLRAIINTVYVMVVTFPLLLVIFKLMCNSGSVFKHVVDPTNYDSQYVLKVRQYIICKCLYAIICTLLAAPLIEFGSLNRANIKDDVFEKYVAAVKKREQAVLTTPVHHGELGMSGIPEQV